MADSLFDNRYRYDYIYPRGRSGETLRAVDTQEHDRPVVIKRPAPNDAPPIRAGQEVSILTERRALQRLAGHPVLTALLGSGQFYVGGIPQQYIVVERAEGVIVADEMSARAAHGERLPELEILVIVDALLDLLASAHAQDIVYNDVDAKHLFWDRDHYRLRVIDWGNAVFLEGDEVTPQGVSVASDIYQVGELLYALVTGGGRIEAPRTAGEDFRLDFGVDGARLHSRLQSIISKAAHPSPKLRYHTIAQLRTDLAEYTQPLEKDRRTALTRATERLKRDLSKDELNALQATMAGVQAADPGSPPVRALMTEIEGRLRDLDVAADLDAARIYLDNGSWARAYALLEDLRPRARGETASLIALLLDWTTLLLENAALGTPPGVQDALAMLFEGEADQAAIALITDTRSETLLGLQYLLAERVSSHAPEILLLQPNLYRFEVALLALTEQDIPTEAAFTCLREVYSILDQLARPGEAAVPALREGYRAAVDRISALSREVDLLVASGRVQPNALPVNTLTRALNAAMALADNLHVIGKHAATSPREALAALDGSRQIAPGLPAWEFIGHLLDGLYERLDAFHAYLPAADGSNLGDWLRAAGETLQPYSERLSDEALPAMQRAFGMAAAAWEGYANAVVLGARARALAALEEMIAALGSHTPALVAWLSQLRSIITSADYIERHALAGAVGRALADGWEQFDRGRLADAERLGLQAYEAARSDTEQQAAHRLRDLAVLVREWAERGGVDDRARTEAALAAVNGAFMADENALREQFAAQMPSRETYARAMSRGLVDVLAKSSSGALRLQYVDFTLRAALEAQRDSGAAPNPEASESARFYREAAARTMGEAGLRHPMMRVLAEYIDRRRDLRAGAALLNALDGSASLPQLDAARRALENSAEAKTFAPAVYALNELETGARDWGLGDFRTAGTRFEGALKAIESVEASTGIALPNLHHWAQGLLAAAAEISLNARRLFQMIEPLPDEPSPALRSLHQSLVETTHRALGDAYAGTVRDWRDTYDRFAALYGDKTMRRSARLPHFTDLFAALTLDSHPAYPVYRHWFALTEAAPEFPAPPTDEPTPRMAEIAAPHLDDMDFTRMPLPPEGTVLRTGREAARARPAGRRLPLFLVAGLVLAGLIVAAVVIGGGRGEAPPPTLAGIADGSAGAANATLVAIALELSETAAFEAAVAALPITRTLNAARTLDATPALDGTPVLDMALATEDAVIVPDQAVTATRTPPATPTALPVLATVPLRGSETPTDTATPVTPSATATPSPTRTSSPTRTLRATATATPSLTPSPTFPPGGIAGDQDILALLAAAPPASPPLWTSEQFAPSSQGQFWRLGQGAASADTEQIAVAPPAALLDARFGNEAPSRIVRVDASLDLATFNPPLLLDDAVYFGLALQSPDGSGLVGLEIQVVQAGIINLAQRTGETRTIISRRSDTADNVRIRLERDLDEQTLSVYYNGDLVGAPLPFLAADAAVIPVLYTHDGGVIVHVLSWAVTLR